METIKRNKEAVLDYLKNYVIESQLLSFHNTMCQNGRNDDEIYENDEDFFKMMFNNKIDDAVRAVCYGNYNYTDVFVKFNAYGNLDSFNDLSEVIDLDELADDMLENESDYEDDIEFEEDLIDVVIEEVEAGTFGIYDESGQCIEGEFNTYSDAYDWIEESGCFNLVDGFNV